MFWVPAEARWAHPRARARQPTVSLTVDQAMAAIDRDNPTLRDVLPRDYARPALDKRRLGQLIDLVNNIRVGDEDARFVWHVETSPTGGSGLAVPTHLAGCPPTKVLLRF